MLNKDICKRCARTAVENYRDDSWAKLGWIKNDESSWGNIGMVYCFAAGEDVSVSGDPPDGCVFAIEHLMKDQETC